MHELHQTRLMLIRVEDTGRLMLTLMAVSQRRWCNSATHFPFAFKSGAIS